MISKDLSKPLERRHYLNSDMSYGIEPNTLYKQLRAVDGI